MQVVHQSCAGLDVHKKTVVACRRIHGRKVQREVRRFATTTNALLELCDWLEEGGCTHVAMEATGAYWKPVWHILEGQFELILANAAHIKNVPGRKSDVQDAQWIADLLAHGLIRSSFVPPRPIEDLRELTRTRKQLRREVARHSQRIQSVLETANVKLSSVLTDVLGKSGRRILVAMISGETDATKLAGLASPIVKATPEELAEALTGRVTAHHRFLLHQHLSVIDHLEETIRQFDRQIQEVLAPFRESVDLLSTIPGISEIAAQILIAEIGLDMTQFPTARHLISWAGLCPRLDESAGKHRSTNVRKSSPWLKPVLVQSGWAVSRAKRTYLQAQFHRIRSRRGPKKAAVAVAASILTAAYHILTRRVPYHELGPEHFGQNSERIANALARRIRRLGYEVDVRKAA